MTIVEAPMAMSASTAGRSRPGKAECAQVERAGANDKEPDNGDVAGEQHERRDQEPWPTAFERGAQDEQDKAGRVDQRDLEPEQEQRRRPAEGLAGARAAANDLIAGRGGEAKDDQQQRAHEQHAADRRLGHRGDEERPDADAGQQPRKEVQTGRRATVEGEGSPVRACRNAPISSRR